MSEDKQTQGIYGEHGCSIEGCKKWGSLGYARTKSEPVKWWCAEHYPFWNMSKPRQEAIDIADMLGGRTTPQN